MLIRCQKSSRSSELKMPPSFQSFRQRLFRLTLPKQGLFYVRILGLILPACEDFSAKNHWQSITVLRKVYLLLQEWLSKGPLSSETQRQLLESLEGLDLDRDSCSQIGASLVEFADFLGIAAIHLRHARKDRSCAARTGQYCRRACRLQCEPRHSRAAGAG